MDFGEEKLNIRENYFKMENELNEWITKTNKLGKPERKILDAIIRRTNGYNRVRARISIRMFAKMANIDRRNVWTYIQMLLNKKIIFRYPGKKDKFGKPVYYYSINPKYRRYNYAKPSENDVKADIKLTPMPAVAITPIKDSDTTLKKETQDLVNRVKNYKKHYEDKNSSSNEK
ncbi:MAG: replication protein [Elusimicrobiales bacterium]|nr:replication protein [Elusimicrobiales bacterium]